MAVNLDSIMEQETVPTASATAYLEKQVDNIKLARTSRSLAVGGFVLYVLATLILTVLGLLAWSANSVIWLLARIRRAFAAAFVSLRAEWRRPPAARDFRRA